MSAESVGARGGWGWYWPAKRCIAMTGVRSARTTTAELVQLAWDVLPPAHRQLLTQAGASAREIVSERLGDAVAARLGSANEPAPSRGDTAANNEALGMWVPGLRLVLINDAHPALQSADRDTRAHPAGELS